VVLPKNLSPGLDIGAVLPDSTPTRASSPTLVALTSFACEVKGVEYIIRHGQVVPGNHPAVKGREELFEAHDPNRPDAA
jgi:hypothetical protein